MGSRGSSSGRGVGKHGAGMEGKETGATVKSSHYMTDEIGEGGGSFVNEVMTTRDNLEQIYGDSVRDLNLQAATFSDGSVLGAYGGNTLFMAERYIKNTELTNVMKQAAKDGYHPSIGNFSGAEAVTAHEIGHRLGEVAAQRAGISEKDIVSRAASTLGIKTENMGGHISGYARTNYGETIAEACADVYCNGSGAARASRAIMNEVKKALS